MKGKRFVKVVLFFAMLAAVSSFFAGCADKEKDYYGTYTSIFVDSQNSEEDIEFILTLNKDGSFELKRSPKVKLYKGTWKTYTESGKKQWLCYVRDEDRDRGWAPYFSLFFLDDGTLMATPASTFSSMSSTAAFETGLTYYISLVLFEKSVG